MKEVAGFIKDDGSLWKEFRQGSMEAFSAIYSTHVQALNNYGRKLTTDQKFVEDCIQDLFIEIWKSKENLGDTDSIKYYLLKSLRRKIIRQLPGTQTLGLDAEENYHFDLSSPETLIINEQTEAFQVKKLNEALKKLTRRQKEAIYLKFYQGLNFQEVSSVMSLGMKSTYNLISRSVEELRKHISKSDVFILLFLLISIFI